jgi:hypothetical protein
MITWNSGKVFRKRSTVVVVALCGAFLNSQGAFAIDDNDLPSFLRPTKTEENEGAKADEMSDAPEEKPSERRGKKGKRRKSEDSHSERSSRKAEEPVASSSARAEDVSSDKTGMESELGAASPPVMTADPIETAAAGSSSRPPLQGSAEVLEVILDEQPLFKEARASIEKEDYGRAIGYLQQLQAQFGEGYEPLKAECMYYEAGCHQRLSRQKAAMDTYHKAFELFEKYDSSNPLKGKAWNDYFRLKHPTTLQGNVAERAPLGILMPQKAQIAIDPNAVLEVRDNNRDIPVLSVNDKAVLPLIVKECFSDMNCLETAEIGSNVTNATQRWMPLMVYGKAAAFGMNSSATGHPAFKAKVNGRMYTFDVVLPDMGQGLRKILLVTNMEKICAVDVDSFDTWLLRMTKAKDGRILTARWYKLTHIKPHVPVVSPAANPQQFLHPNSKRNW